MLRLLIVAIVLVENARAQACDPNPCLNGRCSPGEGSGNGLNFICICQDKWAGIKCDLPQPEVICGNRSIGIFIDKRIVTEQGLPGSPEWIHFLGSPGCMAEETPGGYYLEVKAPFKDCGITVIHDGDDYTFYQQVVWNNPSDDIERPLVLLNFRCSYEDKYTVSFGPITPLETAVRFETSYGVFKVNMALYRGPTFENSYGVRPVVTVEDDVCVSTELENVMPKDLVLTNRECWASTQKDGTGESHYFVYGKCKDDPGTSVLSNGESDFARFCFQMFRWKEAMEKVFVNCVVNVCNATLDADYCKCEDGRAKRFARSIPPEKDGARITFGPVYVMPEGWDENQLEDGVLFDSSNIYVDDGAGISRDTESDSKTEVLISVGVVLVIALILLGVTVAVYINCKKGSRGSKSRMRNEGDSVVIPTPVTDDAMLN